MSRKKLSIEGRLKKQQDDAEANQFAMAILVPMHLLTAEIKKLGGFDLGDGKMISKLAKKFIVSEDVMAIRISHYLEINKRKS